MANSPCRRSRSDPRPELCPRLSSRPIRSSDSQRTFLVARNGNDVYLGRRSPARTHDRRIRRQSDQGARNGRQLAERRVRRADGELRFADRPAHQPPAGGARRQRDAMGQSPQRGPAGMRPGAPKRAAARMFSGASRRRGRLCRAWARRGPRQLQPVGRCNRPTIRPPSSPAGTGNPTRRCRCRGRR